MEKKSLALEFQNPGNEWRGKPFWSWNGELEKEELLRQVHILQEMGFGGHFMHSRSGLATEYLGEEWFDMINAVTDESVRAGMESWLYDEDRWPSGSAGGKVTQDPSLREKKLILTESDPAAFSPMKSDLADWLIYLGEDRLSVWFGTPVTEQDDLDAIIRENPQEKPGTWKALRFAVHVNPCDSNYNGTTYIDTMNEKATRRFIDMTHEEYVRHCGSRIGSDILGIFTDEPRRGAVMGDLAEYNGIRTCSIPWTDDLAEEYEKRYGENPISLLPRMFYRWNGEKADAFRLNYFDMTQDLFLKRFAKPLNDWCNAHNMIFTGHALHEDSLTNQASPQGSLMRFYEYQGIPGMDNLGQFSRCYWAAKQISSSCRQLGKKRILSELYGCTGWEFDFRGHKAVGDWQALFGINLRCPHLSWYTMEGQAKRDYPASILHQSPWYKDYAMVEDYFARFGLLMAGDPECDVLVLNPIESVWALAHMGWANWLFCADDEVEKYENAYKEMFFHLTGNHIDFDYGDEEMMSRLAGVEKDADGRPVLRVGKMAYHEVVIGGQLTMRSSTLKLLQEFSKADGKIIFAGTLPSLLDGVPTEEIRNLADKCVRVPFASAQLTEEIRSGSAYSVSVTGTDASKVFVQVRRHPDGKICAVVLNTDADKAAEGLTLQLQIPAEMQPQEWDMAGGSRFDATEAACFRDGMVSIPCSLPAGGTRAFVFAPEAEALPPCPAGLKTVQTLSLPAVEMPYRLEEENICVLDFTRWRWTGGTWSDSMEALKADMQIRDTLGLEHRSGRMLQPWYSRKQGVHAYGSLELEYTFEIGTLPEGTVTLAAERPEWMHYAVNGVPLAADGSFWVDICFKRMPIPAGVLKKGRNTVTVTTAFTEISNVEALYLLGNFGVHCEGHRASLTVLPETLHWGSLKEQGLPFYTGRLTYTIPAECFAKPAEGQHVFLKPMKYCGALVTVTTKAGSVRLGWEPLEADITDAVRSGEEVQLTLSGTRRNTFGPLHMNPPIADSYGPNSFVTEGDAWSDDYLFTESGVEGVTLEYREKI